MSNVFIRVETRETYPGFQKMFDWVFENTTTRFDLCDEIAPDGKWQECEYFNDGVNINDVIKLVQKSPTKSFLFWSARSPDHLYVVSGNPNAKLDENFYNV